MSKILHFLNGDSTKYIFDQTAIKGDVAVMRETYCSGPLNNAEYEELIDIRKDWFAQQYYVDEKTYEQRVQGEINKMEGDYDEIHIWYEYDVFCHINMIALVHAALIKSNAVIKLVYSPTGIGRLTPEELTTLSGKAIRTTSIEQQVCATLWEGLEFHDHTAIHQAIKAHHPTLPNLSNALRAYMAQNHGDPEHRPIELRIKVIIRSGITTGKHIVGQLLRTDKIFGYGDLQYMLILTSMTDVLDFEPIAAKNMDGFIKSVFEREFALKV